VRRLQLLVLLAAVLSVPTTVCAQDVPLRARIDEPRLWGVAWNVVPPPSVEVRPAPPTEPVGSGADFAAGYVLGGLMGLGLAAAEPPPRELGLWLRGWYEGISVPGMPPPWPAGGWDRPSPAFTPYGGGEPPVLDGIVRGFLRALATTSNH